MASLPSIFSLKKVKYPFPYKNFFYIMDMIKFKCDTVSDEDWKQLQNLKMYIDRNGAFIFEETSDNFVYYLFRKNKITCEINNVKKNAQVFYWDAVDGKVAVRLYE